MSLTQFFRIFSHNLVYLLLVPLLTGVLLFIQTNNLRKKYQSNVVIYAITKSQTAASTGDAVRMDFFTSSNLFDNITLVIKSRETLKESALRLMALHLSLLKPEDTLISKKAHFDLLANFTPQSLKELQVINDSKATLMRLKSSKGKTYATIDYLLRTHPHYSYIPVGKHIYYSI